MQNPLSTNSVVASARRTFLNVGLLLALACGSVTNVSAQIPDLTNGEPRLDNLYWNLGPTGMSGWFYRPNYTAKYDGWNTQFARQIEVMTVDTGSPAAGILQVGDVILGADGSGANPVNFTSDARKAFAYAIADAEASTPATLKLLVWRAGTTSTMSLTLETLGAYSATAPYNCPKSAAVLEKGLDAIMAQGGSDGWKFSLITLLAGNDPSNPNNAARMARAQQEAYALILTPEQIAEYTAPEPLSYSKIAWRIGFQLTALAEYYLHTGDPAVYESLRAYAIAAANGQTMFGTSGHQFARKAADGSLNGPYGIGYGVVSSANMQCFLGLALAKQAGVTDQAVLDAVERAANFYSAYVDRGTIPYGEHSPGTNYGDNGKSGIAALCFKAEGTRNYDANYYATLAASAADNLDAGHQGPWLNYLWTPLGANAGGEEAMAAFFAEQSWRFDLARNYDGTFTYNSYQNGGQYGYGGKTWSGTQFQMYQAMLLPYAVPLRETFLTGKNTADSAEWLSATVVDDVQVSSGYDATTRTTNELIADLGIWSPVTRIATAAEIGQRSSEHAALLPTLHSMAMDTNGSLQSRMGACKALGAIADDSSVPDLVALLSDTDTRIQWQAANALRSFSQSALMAELNAIMVACATMGKPTLPLDPEDPVHVTHQAVVNLLFADILVSHDLVGINRNLLYPAIHAAATHPMGKVRESVSKVYSELTREDAEALADILVDGSMVEAPADRMFSQAIRMEGIKLMQAHNFAEGVPIAMFLTEELNSITALNTLIAYAGDSLLVEPDHEVLKWLDVLEAGDASQTFTNASNWPAAGTHNHIQWVRDAIVGDPGPYEKPESFKRIYTVYADDATLTLPDYWTGLHVGAYDFAQGDTVYTWRKVHGAGDVSFYPNGTAAAKDTTVIFDGAPGEYLFEVKVSDSLGFSEVTQTVAVTLEKVGGGLDPNLAPTADGQSVTVVQGTPTQIMLTGSDPEGYSLDYTVTSGPSNGTLSGTAPSLVYTASAGYTGSDSISFEVMDSEGQVASGTVSITVNTGAPVGLAIYEPFDYADAAMLNGLSGSTEIGFADASTWTAGGDIYVDATATTGGTSPNNAFDAASANTAAGGYAYGPLPTTGSKLWNRAMNSIGQSRPINPNALTNSGLLADGATLWFSVLIGADDTWLRDVQIALGNASFGSTKNFIQDDGADPGTGLGFEFNADKQFYAVQFFDATQSTPLRGDFNLSAAGQFVRFGDLRLVVGKITWGASSDTVEMYLPLLPEAGASIILPDQPSSTLVANVDQSKFDVLTVSRGSNVWVDEIRFGSTLQSVLMGTVDAGGIANDGVAPTPNPMTFAVVPSMMSQDSITMTATPAYDPLGVEYYFTCTAGAGGSDSGWQDSNVYTNSGLTPGVAYSYTVKARDKTPGLNETAASAAASATIPALGTVPNLVGIEQSIAETLLADAGMVLGTVTDAVAYSQTVPAGHVLSQSPVGPVSAAYGSAVALEISIGQDPTLPTLASVDIVDDKGALPVTLPATINYTLTFSQDMDAATIDAGDFINLGDLPIVIGSINEIAPGVITVEVIPNSIDGGTLLFAVAQGAVIQDALGNALNTSSAIVDRETISIVRPANYAPTVDAGPDQTVSMDSPQPWSPYLMNAAAWYDAADAATITQSGGKVSKWDDKSGNGNHASQGNTSTQPSYNASDAKLNNLPTVGYDQAFKTLVTGNSFTAQRAYVVTYYDQATFGSWHNAVTDKGNTIRFVGGNSGQNYLTSGPAKTGTAYQNGDRAANLVDGSNPAVLPMSASVWTVTANATTLDQWILLGGSVNYSGWQNGALAEVILTDGSESLETQQMVEGYLAHKWGLEASLAADHPYKLEAPTSPAALAVLDATVNDKDNDPLTTFWTMVSGPQGVTFGNGSSVDTTATLVEAGTYVLQLSANDTKEVVSDQVTITVNAGSDTTPPTLSSSEIVDDRGGADVTENALVTYTVTFSEDMNAATVEASDFGNAGTAPLTMGTIAETSPGVFTVGVTPTGLGTIQLQINAGASLNDLAGNSLDTSAAIVDDTTINVVAAPPSNNAPVFTADPFSASAATENVAYVDSIAGSATDADTGDTLSYSKVGGPTWLSVAANGDLTGTATNGDVGLNAFTVIVSDGNGGSDSATLSITVNAVVVNNPPVVDAGTTQTVSLTAGGGAWTPAETTAVAWFDAADASTITESAGAVSQWRDKSGNGKHANQGNASLQPTYNGSDVRLNGLPTIGYDQGYKFLDTPNLAAIKNVYFVTYYDDPDNSFDSHRVFFSDTGNANKLQGQAGSDDWVVGKGFDKYKDGSSTSSDLGILPMGATLWTAKGTASHTNKTWRMLGGIQNYQYWEYGAIGEIILTDGTEDLETQQKIEGYLAHKWGLEANLPAGHPYKSAAPTGGSAAVANIDGTVSDPDSDPFTTLWTFVSGPAGVTFGDAAAEDTTATFTAIGTYVLELTANDSTAQTSDQVTITVDDGSDTIAPTLAASDFVDDKAGANVTENDLVTYTVTFSEDMDETTVDAADFSNAGSSSVTIGTITETTPGVFTVEATPTDAGTLQLQVSATAVLSDVAGNTLNTASAIVDDTTITVNQPTTTVPNVVGLAQATAESNIVSANLLVGNIITQYDVGVSAGDVISQNPTGGNVVVIGSPVDLVVSLGPPQTTVPNVIGQVQATAESNIVAANLVVGTVTSQYDAGVSAGNVISQNPVGNTTVVEGSSVDLVISLGPPLTTVPNVVGLAQATAESSIVAANLVVGTVTSQNDAVVPAGDVISQSPVGTTSVAEGSSVDLVISLGPVMTDVPNVVGLAQATAESSIVAANLVVGTVTSQNDAVVPAGDVISQSPVGTTSVAEGSSVDLVISLGPVMTNVPNVVGLAQATAESSIVAANLVVGTVTSQNDAVVPAGDVISQSPVGTTSVAEGSSVDLVISLGPVMTDVPNVVGLAQATAESNIVAANLVVGTVTSQNDAVVPAGDVISQSPIGTTSVAEGSSVDLVISLGPVMTDVPNVVGLAQATAESSIVAANLVVGTVTSQNDAVVPAGDVISQSPIGTTSVAEGSSVDLVISLGPVMTDVPNVVGLAQATAESNIVAANLVVGAVTSQNDAVVPAGDVISQSPVGTTSVAEGSSVDLVISLGPVMTNVPNVVGLAQATAESSIVAANLVVGTVTSQNDAVVPAGDVISQSPIGTTSVAEGSSVDLVISLGPVMTKVPNVVGLAQATAESSIVAANLVVGTVTTQYSETVPSGDVISQNPTGGSSVNEGSSVDLIVSDGPNPSPSSALIVESFEDSDSSLDGNAAGTGLTGTWSGSGATVVAGNVSYGSLPVSGNKVEVAANYASVSTGGTLSGYLDDGDRLWFSVAVHTGTDIGTNPDIGFAFGTNNIGSTNNLPMNDAGDGGLGLGFTIKQNQVHATWWDPNDGNGTDLNRSTTNNGNGVSASTSILVVGELVFGATDTLNIYLPDTALNLGSVVSTASVSFDQTLLDTISFAAKSAGGPHTFDEIRFGETFDSVIGGTVEPDTTPPALAGSDIVDDKGGANVTENDLVIYTVTFSEDMDETTVDATDFSNAGTSSVTIGTITETSPGVFTVEATPTNAGTLQLQVSASAVFTDVAGNALDTALAIVDDTTITVDAATTTVPDVVGLAQATAESDITSANLTVGTITTQYDAVVPAGDVVSQNPTGGSVVVIGSPVDLVVSLGVQMVNVPDVVGLAQASAESAITSALLTVGTVTTEYSATVSAGDVISQGLGAGASVPVNSAVDLVVSLGIDISPKLVRTTVTAVSNTSWTTVGLGQTYNNAVIIATPIYPSASLPPVVTRITNVTSTGFDLKIDRADGLTAPVSIDVAIVAVDEGVYTQAVDGVTMEAVKFTSTITAYGTNNWAAESRSYQNSYTTPVVIGQVMSSNDANWSTFWSMGASRQDAVDASNLNVGKHVGQDSNRTRADEVIGYIVIEAGNGTANGVAYEAGLGAATVQCFGDSATPYSYSLSGSLATVSTAAVSQSGMSGNDGAWAVLSGTPYVTATSLNLHVAEDEFKDSRQRHSAEHVAFIVFE